MAFWAMSMFWIAAAQAGLTAVGILFIWRALDYTRKAVEEAENATKVATESVGVSREIGQAQVRAYLSCTGGTYKIGPYDLICYLDIANSGQSPATNVVISASMEG
jgi:hypothetical protein